MSTTPLSDSRELVERSLFHSIRKELVDKGYLPDINEILVDDITAISQVNKTFTISGNRVLKYTALRKFTVKHSTGNDGEYTIQVSSFISGNTVIRVKEAIPDSNVDGDLNIYKYYDDNIGVSEFNDDIIAIQKVKGFAIEVFGQANNQSRYLKKVPRIVISTNQSLPGALGGAPDKIYTPVNGDMLAPDLFIASIQPPQTVNISFDIYLVSNTAEQSRVLHGILALSVPKRGYVKFYNDESKNIFVNQFSYRSFPDNANGIMEDIYMYQAEDIFETANPVLPTNFTPIQEIKVETREGKPNDSSKLTDFTIT